MNEECSTESVLKTRSEGGRAFTFDVEDVIMVWWMCHNGVQDLS